MKRREFITVLGGAVAWPLAASAQPTGKKVYRVGWFFSATPLPEMAGPDPISPVGKILVHGLGDLGYVEGQNLILDRVSAEGKYERIGELAAELVSRNPDVIVIGANNKLAQALQRVTKTVPIIMPDSEDPVGAGLVKSLARPGGNITGFSGDASLEFETKRLELLKQAVPDAVRVAFLGTKDGWESLSAQRVRVAAQKLGVTLILAEQTPSSYADAFALIDRDRPDALFVARSAPTYVNSHLIADFEIKERLPAIYPYKTNVTAGGLMCYGVDEDDLWRRTVVLIDKILKGANPAGIPVEEPTKFDLVINLKTAKALGLAIPPPLLAIADEVIE
jgi:putative tryptophan/tyrosine transport system substrate-binding protein